MPVASDVLASMSHFISKTDFRGVETSVESMSLGAETGFISDSGKMQSAALSVSGPHPSGDICFGSKEAGIQDSFKSRGTVVSVRLSAGRGTARRLRFTCDMGHLGRGVGATSLLAAVGESVAVSTAVRLGNSRFGAVGSCECAADNDAQPSSVSDANVTACLAWGTDKRRGITGGPTDFSPSTVTDFDSLTPFGGKIGESQSTETEF